MDEAALNYNPEANQELEGSCIDVVLGCMSELAFNFNPNANVDDGSCIAYSYGCTDATAFNYDSIANTDDGSCVEVINGCIDSTAINYNIIANTDNGSCIYPLPGCTDPTAVNFNALANVADSSCYYSAGCASGDVYYLPDACFEWVIQVDQYCCSDAWDNTCYELYNYCEEGWTGPVDIHMYKRSKYLPYPNPTKDYINFNEKVDVLVIDNLGKNHKLYKNTTRIKLDKGINYIKVSNDKVSFTTIIIVQ